MKHNSKLNRSRWLLLTLFTLIVGASPAWGQDPVTIYSDADYSSEVVPFDGYNADAVQHNQMIFPSSVLTSLNGKAITSMTFYYKKNESTGTNVGNWIVSLAETNETSLAALDTTTPLTQVFSGAITPDTEAKTITITFAEGYQYNGGNLLVDFNHPVASGYKKFTFWCAYIDPAPAFSRGATRTYLPKTTFTYESATVAGPAFVVKDGSTKLSSPYAFNFGLATAGTTKTFTLSNPGTAAVEGLSVSETGSFGATLSATSIAAGDEATLTITMPSTTGSSTITISSTTEGIDDFIINASGTVRDPNKVYESGFTSLPEEWTTTGTWYYSAANGAYTTVWYLSSNARLVTPKLTIAEGEKFFVEAKGYSTSNTSYQHLQMQYSSDGTTWTNFDDEPSLDPENWNTFEFTGCPAGSYYIAINASQADIRMFYGGQLPTGAKFAITPNTAQDFGAVDKDAASPEKSFTVTNSGNANLNVAITAPEGFTAEGNTLLFTKPDGWSSVYVHSWSSEGDITTWPGIEAAYYGKNVFGDDQYAIVVPDNAIGIVISDNGDNNKQTSNITNFNVEGYYIENSTTLFWGSARLPILNVAGGKSGSFTVKMNTATAGVKNGTLSLAFTALNAESPFDISVSGVVIPNDLSVEDFSGTTIPSGWTSTGSWDFTTDGVATGTSSSAYLYTPKLQFSAGDFIVIKCKNSDGMSGDYITITGSSNNGSTYPTSGEGSYNNKIDLPSDNSEWSTYVITDIPTTINKLRFTGAWVIVDEIRGLTYAPQLSVTKGGEAVSTPANYDFGETSANATVTYNFANAGAGTINITNVAITGAGAAAYSTNWTESTAAPFDLVITRTYDSSRAGAGAQEAVVTVTTSDGDFVINVTGTDMAAGANFAIDTDGTTPENLGLVAANDVAKKNFTITNSGNAPLVVTFTDDTDFYASTVSFTRPNDAGWGDNVYIYAWNSSDEPLLGAWPGKLVTESELNNMNERVYTARLPQNTYGIIFHDNTDAHKTRDIKSGVGDDPEFKQIMGIYLDNKDVQKPTFWKNENLTIPAGESKTFTVRMASATTGEKSGNIALAFTASNATEFTIPVKGIVTATGSEVVDFNTAIPARWENQDNGWSIYNNEAAKCTGKKNLTTQKLDFSDEDNPFFVMKVKASDSGYGDYVTVEGSTDNGATWEAFDKKTYSYSSDFGANTGDYSTIVVSIPNTVNKLRFNGYCVLIDEIAGLKYSANDPTIAVKDAENADVVSGTTKDFGWAQTAQSATYKISNSGTGTLTISDITAPDGFTAATAGDVKTVTAGADPLVLTVTMTNAAIGAKSGTVTLTTDGGNFEIPVKGFIYGDRNLVDFTDASQYQGWTGVNVTDNAATLSSTAIETTPFAATAAEPLYVEIKGNSSYTTHSFSYSYSRDGGANWSEATALVASTYSAVPDQVFTITDIADAEAASNVMIRFTGAGLSINRIYGFEALTVPVMTLDKTADYNFGMQTANAEYVITVTNTGTATLNNLAATLESDTNYSVAITKPEGESTTTVDALTGKATVPAGQQAIITVTQLFDANNGLASLSDVLTISGDDVESEEINLSGKTRNGSKWYVDFASGIPASFIEKGSWSYTSQQGYTFSKSALVSQTLTIAANEKIQFDAKQYSSYYASNAVLKVRHSVNGGLTWSDYTDLTGELGLDYTTLQYSVGNTDASAVAMIEFLGAYVYLDNIYGGALNNEAPMIQVKKSSTVVASGVTEEFGSILAEASANYTIKNIGGGTLTITSPITTVTGVATAAVDVASLGNNDSATLTITMPVEAPYGEKAGVVTVKTSLGDFVINYTATTKNPNTLNVDFSDNTLPAGWYKESGWNNYDQIIYRSDRYSDAYFMTQKLQVAGTSDVLSFDAKKYSTTYASSTVLKVSYSTDRVNWTEIGDYASEMTTSWKTFEISGLAAGEYYLKFEGRYASIDNIIGWEKVAGIDHDLYVTATSFPAATDKGDDATISATVTSLRAAETGVYAKLFIDGEQEGEASAAQDIALNGTKTFSFTYAIPEKKTAQIKVYYSDDTEAFATAVNTMKVNYALSETSSDAITTGTYDVTLTRSFQQGWNSICLPFAVEDIESVFGEGAKVYQFTSYTSSYVTFETVGEMNAGTPYLIKMPEASSEAIVLNDCNITTADAGSVEISDVTFQGTYAPMEAETLTGKYGITTENDIRPATAEASMDGFRAYLIGSLAGARIMIFDETTGIKTVYGSKEILGDGRVYNLNGQHVENAKKGVYIVNGKKVVIK